MGRNIVINFFLGIVLLSCKEKINLKSRSTIDYEKIDALFAKRTPPVLFDHLYIVLDSSSYTHFLKAKEWMENYASIDEGLPHFTSVTDSATTSYIRGHRHYLELLGPANTYGEPEGKGGIGFCLSNNAQSFNSSIRPELKKENTPYLMSYETVAMPLNGEKAVWFKAFYTPGPKTNVHSWYAFYNPAFLKGLYGSDHDTYTREAFLKTTYAPEKLFKEVSSIEITCNHDDYHRIAQEMRHLGCTLLKKEANNLTVRSGDIDIKIKLYPEIRQSRIDKLQCTLNHPDESVTTFGNLVITNSGHQSIWTFKHTF